MPVTDLKLRIQVRHASAVSQEDMAHVYRQTRFFADHRSSAYAHLSALRATLSRQPQDQTFFLSRPVPVHDIRAAHLSWGTLILGDVATLITLRQRAASLEQGEKLEAIKAIASMLARISHQSTAAGVHLPEFNALRSDKGLDVLKSTPALFAFHAPSISGHLRALASRSDEKCGLDPSPEICF